MTSLTHASVLKAGNYLKKYVKDGGYLSPALAPLLGINRKSLVDLEELRTSNITAHNLDVDTIRARDGLFFTYGASDLISNSLAVYGEWAHEELEFLKKFIRPNDRIADVGSFIGTHTASFSHLVGSQGNIFCFEPNPVSHFLLNLNICANGLDNVLVSSSALGALNCKARLSVCPSNNGASSLLQVEDHNYFANVRQSTFDRHFSNISVSLIKIDAEGFEPLILRGAMNSIKKDLPIIYCEVNSLSAGARLFRWAGISNYLVYGAVFDAFNPSNFFLNKEDIFFGGRESALLMVAIDRLGELGEVLNDPSIAKINDLDDMVRLLLRKPQYRHSVLI